MALSWESRTGRIDCRWSEVGRQTPYRSAWMEGADATDYSGYLPPPVDFASHSALGGPSWFDRWHYGEARSR